MSNCKFGADTICPFYEAEAKKSITCEGLIPDTVSMTKFGSVDTKTKFQTANCAMYNYGNSCPIAAALIRKYEDEECSREKSKSRS